MHLYNSSKKKLAVFTLALLAIQFLSPFIYVSQVAAQAASSSSSSSQQSVSSQSLNSSASSSQSSSSTESATSNAASETSSAQSTSATTTSESAASSTTSESSASAQSQTSSAQNESSTSSEASVSSALSEVSSSASSESSQSSEPAVVLADKFVASGPNTYVTNGVVQTGVKYVFPLNAGVTIEFSKLPTDAKTVTAKQIVLSAEKVAELNAASNTGYEFTTEMLDGTFEYTMTLPNPIGEKAKVIYADSVSELNVDQDIQTTNTDVVSFTADHFTIFVVTSFEEVQTVPTTTYNGIWNASGTGSSITQVVSGTDGIVSSEGDNHAKVVVGAFTPWNGYKSVFPTGGYDTRVDLYLNTALSDGIVDKRIDFSSAINNQSGAHLRDFIFHIGTNPTVAGELVASASNNSVGWPSNPANSPVSITTSGWYTLEHQFRNVADVLVVNMNLYQAGNPTPVGTWTRSTPTDVISTLVGGNRYGWFIDTAAFKFDWVAIDNAEIEYNSIPINQNNFVVETTNWQGWIPATTVGGQVSIIDTLDSINGDGVLNLTTQNDVNDRASITRAENVDLSSIYKLSYSTKRDAAGFIAAGNASYRVLIDADGNTATTNDIGYLVHEPYWQNAGSPDDAPVQAGVWQTWSVMSGSFWASIPGGNSIAGLTNGSGGPPFYTLQNVLALHPNAKVIGVNVGIGSYNQNYNIQVDNVVFGYQTGTSIEINSYNFEPLPPVVPIVDIVEARARILSGMACGLGSAWSDDGLEVNIANWEGTYQLQGRYFTNGGAFGAWFDLTTWSTLNVSGSDAAIFLNHSGDAPAGAAGWEVRVVDVSDTNTAISNVDTLNYIIDTNPNTFVCNGKPQNLSWVAQATPIACGGTTSSYTAAAMWDAFDSATQYEYSVTTPVIPTWTTTVGGTSYAGVFNQGAGVYTFKVRAVAPYTTEFSAECAVTFDPTLAVPTLVSPVYDAVVNTSVLNFDWTDVTSLNGPLTYQFQSSFGATTGGANNAFTAIVYTSAALGISEIASPGNADMVAYWQARACDTVTCSSWSAPWRVNIDNTAPVITVNNGVEAGPVLSDTINVSVSDTHLNAATLGFAFSADNICNSLDTYSTAFTSAIDFVINTEATNGQYLCATAADLAGNRAYALVGSNDINVDITAPSVPVNGLPHDTLINTNNFFFTWDASTDLNPIIYEYKASLNPSQTGGVLDTNVWDNTSSANPAQNPLNTPTILSVGAPDGEWFWQVRAIDSLGNASAWSEIWNVTLDTVAPIFIMQDVTINEGDAAPILGAFVFSNPEELDYDCTPTSFDPTDLIVDMPDMINSTPVSCTVTDAAGNTTTTSANLIVNNVLPTVTIDAAPSIAVVAGTTVTLTANTTGSVNAITSWVWADDCTSITDTDVLTSPAAGTYNCDVVVTDVDGDTATDSITITVTAPVTSSSTSSASTSSSSTTSTTTSTTTSAPTGGTGTGGTGNAGNTNTGNAGEVLAATTTSSESSSSSSSSSFGGSVLGELTCSTKFKLSGFVYIDANSNKVREADEAGAKDVRLELSFRNLEGQFEIIGTVTTNVSGDWNRDVCPATYRVRLLDSSLPAGTQINGDAQQLITVGAQAVAGLSFALISPSGFNWWPFILLLLLIAGGFGFWYYKKDQEEQAK